MPIEGLIFDAYGTETTFPTSGHGRREATRDELIFAFTLPRSTTRHKLGIQRYKGKDSRQIETLFERPA
jgi:hypothetical protein